MDPIDYLIERSALQLQQLDLTERQASIQATGRPDALRYIRTRRAMPSPPRLRDLAIILKATPSYLLGETHTNHWVEMDAEGPEAKAVIDAARKSAVGRDERYKALQSKPVMLPRDVPVYTADSFIYQEPKAEDDDCLGVEGSEIDFDAPSGHFRRLPDLFNMDSVYGIYTSGTDLEPAIESGSPIIVNPRRPARARDFVVVYLKSSAGIYDRGYVRTLIKRLTDRNSEYVELQQFNPTRLFRIPMSEVHAIHRICLLADFIE